MKALNNFYYFTPSHEKLTFSPHLLINEQHKSIFPSKVAILEGNVYTIEFRADISERQVILFKHLSEKIIQEGFSTLELKPYQIQDDDHIKEIKFYFYVCADATTRKQSLKKNIIIESLKKRMHGLYLNNGESFPFSHQNKNYDLRIEFLNSSKASGYFNQELAEVSVEKEMFESLIDFDGDDFTLEEQNPETDKVSPLKNKIPALKQKMLNMKVGGMKDKLEMIYRRVINPRRCDPKSIKKNGIEYVKGILLHGPPGTGKTLLARELSKFLEVQPRIINGPEIIDKFYGEGEKKLREAFEPAIQDYKNKGDKSPLHVIIIDEIDSFSRKRGNQNSVGDTMVNQLLTLLDGVDSPNNILVIAMTNRKDLIDDAVLRAGRLEVHVEVGLPDRSGREQIFNIHLKSIKKNGSEEWNEQIKQYARATKNYTGAEIKSVKNLACDYALQEQVQNGGQFDVRPEHFEKALLEITPQFGQDDKMLQKLLPLPEISYSDKWENYQQNKKKFAKNVNKLTSGKKTVMISGPAGIGKTSLAAAYAKQIDFPYTKIVTCHEIYKLNAEQKLSYLIKVFEDAERCNQSCIVLDDIIRLIEYIPLGEKYNNSVLQLFLNVLKAPREKNKVLVIIATGKDEKILDGFGLMELFSHQVQMSHINRDEAIKFLEVSGMKLPQLPNKNQFVISELKELGNFEESEDEDS